MERIPEHFGPASPTPSDGFSVLMHRKEGQKPRAVVTVSHANDKSESFSCDSPNLLNWLARRLLDAEAELRLAERQ